MFNNKFTNYILLAVILIITSTSNTLAQDTITTNTQVDSTKIDTIVIRRKHYKIKHIPRGVELVSPKISFKNTKPLSKRFKRFRPPSFWEEINKLSLSISEVAFFNWKAGGNNSVSVIANGRFERNYKFRYINWKNILNLRFGSNAQEGQKPRKTDDAIRFSSAFSYRRDTISNWYYSAKANFNTQFSNGFKYPDRDTPISRFMAPGYFFFGAGTSYIPENKKFILYMSPITLKSTFVLDQNLADKGAYGVQKAILDANGNVISPGKTKLVELGLLINHSWEKEIYKNVEMDHRISLYTDYLNSFGNIDIDWELKFKLIVNKYISANIGTHVIYDDDILFDPIKNENGIVIDEGVQRIQFKQIIGVGVEYNF